MDLLDSKKNVLPTYCTVLPFVGPVAVRHEDAEVGHVGAGRPLHLYIN